MVVGCPYPAILCKVWQKAEALSIFTNLISTSVILQKSSGGPKPATTDFFKTLYDTIAMPSASSPVEVNLQYCVIPSGIGCAQPSDSAND